MRKKIVRRRKRRFGLSRFATTFLLISAIAYVASALFLLSYNNNLSTKKQQIDAQIAQLQVQNDAVAVEVNTLNNRDRVNAIAGDDGLSMDQSNIVTITKTNAGE